MEIERNRECEKVSSFYRNCSGSVACVVLIDSREASLPCICDNGLQFTEYEGGKK